MNITFATQISHTIAPFPGLPFVSSYPTNFLTPSFSSYSSQITFSNRWYWKQPPVQALCEGTYPLILIWFYFHRALQTLRVDPPAPGIGSALDIHLLTTFVSHRRLSFSTLLPKYRTFASIPTFIWKLLSVQQALNDTVFLIHTTNTQAVIISRTAAGRVCKGGFTGLSKAGSTPQNTHDVRKDVRRRQEQLRVVERVRTRAMAATDENVDVRRNEWREAQRS